MWAILSGIEGNLAAYNAVLKHIKQQIFSIENLYILGDFIGANPESEQVVQHLRYPQPEELCPQICRGWWEEQCLILHSLGVTGEPTELLQRYGGDTVKQLCDTISRETVQWLRHLDFGFVELDCLLIHGSSVNVSEELTPETSPWLLLDRLQRMECNNLFCGRSGQVFEYQLQGGSIATSVTMLDNPLSCQTITTAQRRVIGVGSVGREPGKASYTLYNPSTNQVEFRKILY